MSRLVAVQLDDPVAMLAAFDEVWDAGDAVAPLDATLPPALSAAAFAALHPAASITEDGRADHGDTPEVPDGTALVVTTSGSTGAPKPIVLSHEALRASVAASRARLGAEDGVPWLGVLPLHHVAGISVVLRSRAAGVPPSGLYRRDTPALLRAAPRSWISLVPTQLARLLDAGAGAALAQHAGVLLGGAAAPAPLLERAARSGVRVVTSYGSTETCGGCVYDGVPLDGVEVRLLDDGALAVRGAVVASGVRRPDGDIAPITDDDGWYRTSDLASIDAAGAVAILGRADQTVVSGGENVALAPVRAAVAALPTVAEVAVVGLPDERLGAAVTAVVVPVGPPPTLDELRDALRGALPDHHRPTRLIVVDQLPRDRLGKVTPAAVAAVIPRPGERTPGATR